MIPVCRNVYLWVLQCSHIKVDQTTIPGKYNVEMSGPRVRRVWDAGANECVKQWLLQFASCHLHDPSAPIIILAVATRQHVYDCYKEDFEQESESKYFPHNSQGQRYLPSRSYFMQTWKSDDSLSHIKGRKYHRFTMCDLCVHFIDQRKVRLSEEEKTQLIREERSLHNASF
jgi:hypothetical protein